MTEDRASASAAAVRLSVASALADIADVRRRIRATVMSAGHDESLAHDIALAASELSTNVVQYANTDEFRVTCVRNDRSWVLEVSHADGLETVDTGVADASATSGRGLKIVRALMDTVERIERSDGAFVRCTKSFT